MDRLRERADAPELPVLVVTAADHSNEELQPLREKVGGVLRKDRDLERELAAALHALLLPVEG